MGTLIEDTRALTVAACVYLTLNRSASRTKGAPMARRLVNPVESLNNVVKSSKYEAATTKVGKLVAPSASWGSLESVRRALKA